MFRKCPSLPVQVASIATLTRPQRLERWALWRPDLLVVDECHHVLAPSWRRIIDTLPYARLIGFTATPLRLEGKGLARIFSEMIAATTVKELIAGGWLSPVKTFAPPLLPDLNGVAVRRGDYVVDELAQRMNQQRLVGDCVEHYRRHCNGGAALGYACTIAHSKALVEAFRAAGYRAVHVDADTKASEREDEVAALGAGDINIIFNVGLFTEGLDLPALAGVLMARPTKSLGLYLQMVPRPELVRQTVAALTRMEVPAGVIASHHHENPEAGVQVALVSSLVRPQRLERRALWNPDLLLIDETHHLVAKTWQKLIEVFPEAYTVGFTATPIRLDGKGLGRVFGGMVVVVTVKELMAKGWLAPARHYAPELRPDLSEARTRGGDYVATDAAEAMRGSGLVGDAISHYLRLCDGGSALVYASTIQHSMEIAEQFRLAGVPAQHVDGDTRRATREQAIAALERGELKVLTNVSLFAEGLDLPALAAVILLRPTKSLGLYLQMCGRALRPATGKEFAMIIDHAANVFNRELCDEDHLWQLADRKRSKKAAGAPVKRCPQCGAVTAAAARCCPECEFEFEVKRSAPGFVPGDLEIADPAALLRLRVGRMPRWHQRQWAGTDYDRLKLIAEIRGYAPGWAFWERRRALEAEGRLE